MCDGPPQPMLHLTHDSQDREMISPSHIVHHAAQARADDLTGRAAGARDLRGPRPTAKRPRVRRYLPFAPRPQGTTP
jgi:hypothetical protein